MGGLTRRAVVVGAAGLAAVPGGAKAEGSAKRPFVLVHGSWHGAWCWRRVERLLRAAGHEVYVPTLTGLAERAHLLSPSVNLSTHVADVANLLEVEELGDAVLVGHSYAGLVITGAGARQHGRVKRLVYLDAFVPAPGQSGFDLMPRFASSWREKAKALGEGWWVPALLDARAMGVTDAALARWVDRKLTRMPIAAFDETLQFDEALWKQLDRAYLRCAKYSGFGPTAEKVRAAGWPVIELPCGHDAMLAAPEALATELLALAT